MKSVSTISRRLAVVWLLGNGIALTGCSQLHWNGASSQSTASKESVESKSLGLEIAKGRNFENAGEYDKARSVYEGLRKTHPNDLEPIHRLAVVSDKQRRHKEAQSLYTQAIRKDPKNAELFNDLGYCFYLQGKLNKAESSLRKACHFESGNSKFNNNLGMVLGQGGRMDEAFAQFAKAGSEADAYYNMAFIYASKDRSEEAKKCFRKALAVDPTHQLSRNALVAFQQFEQRSANEREFGLADANGGMVPFQEGSVRQASAEGNSDGSVRQASIPSARDASRTTRALHNSARGLMNRNMASQRQDQQLQ